MEPNHHRLWTESCHFKYTLPSASMCIYLNRAAYPRDCCEESDRFRIQTSELSLICSKTCALPPVHLCEEVDLRPYHLCICVKKSTCVCHYLWQEWLFRLHAFIFLCRTNSWVKYQWNSTFFLILKECYMKWKCIFKKIYF